MVPITLVSGDASPHGRQAHMRLSKVFAWKLPKSFGRMWRTWVHSPWMQTESGENAVGAPMGAPTCPPWVASSAGKSQSGAQAPVEGSQPLGTGPHASTTPPPVTRQPPAQAAGVGTMATHCPVSGLHSWQVGLLQVCGVNVQ